MAIVKKGVVKRKPKTLYYVNKAGDLCSSPMKSRGKKKKTSAKKKTSSKKRTAKKRTSKRKK